METEIEFLLLDPTSTSLLPDSSFSSNELENLMLKVYEKKSNSLSFKFKRFGVDPGDTQNGEKNGSKLPIVAGVIAAVIILIGLVLGKWFYNRRRKNERFV